VTARLRRNLVLGAVAAVAVTAFVVWARQRVAGLSTSTQATDPLFRWEFLFKRPETRTEIWEKGRQHLHLTVVPVALGTVIAAALALLGRRVRWLLGPIYAIEGAMYTIPSLALFSVLVIYNSNEMAATIALTTYTLLIITRGIVVGLDGVPPAALDAADGLGLSARQRLWKVEVPLAAPVIIDAIRVATVTTVGLVGITFVIQLGGFASWIYDGYRRSYSTVLVLGTVLSILLAVALDLILRAIEWTVTPWRHSRAGRAGP
jgi:osmoprotectant transport system permease protein